MPNVEATTEVRAAFTAAHRAAQTAANSIGCAERWTGSIDTDEDDRDPRDMVARLLADAEREACIALAEIRRLRTLTETME